MKKSFIFDMDGVIVNSEIVWQQYENDFLEGFFGKEVASQLGETIGVSVNSQFKKAVSLGTTKTLAEYQKACDELAFRVYDKTVITPGIEALADYLLTNEFRLGLVSSSSMEWIERVLPRLSFCNHIESIVSLNGTDGLRPKPYPDGYNKSIINLGAAPETSVILEDSNTGIRSALASGAYTIAFTGNLVDGYKQIPADAQAKTMNEVIAIVDARFASRPAPRL